MNSYSSKKGNRWNEKKAIKWHKNHPWIVGVNYIPSNAINYMRPLLILEVYSSNKEFIKEKDFQY